MKENKRNKLPWIWIYSALGALFLGIYIFDLGPFAKKVTLNLHAPSVNKLREQERHTKVNDYIDFIRQDQMKMDPGHEFSYQALVKLSTAVGSMANLVDYKLNVNLPAANDYANKIMINDDTHTKDIINSVSIITDGLLGLQQKKYPSLVHEANAVKYAANSLEVEEDILRQRKKLKIFFIRAAEILKKMN